VLHAHFWELAMAGQISAYALEMLRRGPSGYLKVNAPELTKPKAKTLQDDWEAAHGGYRRRVAVLNATTEFHKLQLDPVALELAKMRDYSTLDIALVFGVPPYMLGLTAASDTYANVESRMIELAQFTLYPRSRRMTRSCRRARTCASTWRGCCGPTPSRGTRPTRSPTMRNS
jgi:HK97 family phage portal protein